MLCEKCGKNTATTHIRTVVNGHVYEKHLCDYCANDGYSAVGDNNITQMLTSVFGENKASITTRCDCCGSSFSDIANSGKCGCAQCYTTFYNQLLPYFKRAQYGGTQHKGKNLNNAAVKSNTDNVNELKLLLQQLIKEEKYEQAAIIRDKIKQCKGEQS